MITHPKATVEDLYRVRGKAEVVNGEIVSMCPAGSRRGRAAGKIFASLNTFEEEFGRGFAFCDNVGFTVDLPNRLTFSPDAAWFIGDVDTPKFAAGAPVFAVEIRSPEDYGPAAEIAIQAKIADYFAAGTSVVWDVDLVGRDAVRKYVAVGDGGSFIFRRGEVADAEPAVPGWRFEVDRLFR